MTILQRPSIRLPLGAALLLTLPCAFAFSSPAPFLRLPSRTTCVVEVARSTTPRRNFESQDDPYSEANGAGGDAPLSPSSVQQVLESYGISTKAELVAALQQARGIRSNSSSDDRQAPPPPNDNDYVAHHFATSAEQDLLNQEAELKAYEEELKQELQKQAQLKEELRKQNELKEELQEQEMDAFQAMKAYEYELKQGHERETSVDSSSHHKNSMFEMSEFEQALAAASRNAVPPADPNTALSMAAHHPSVSDLLQEVKELKERFSQEQLEQQSQQQQEPELFAEVEILTEEEMRTLEMARSLEEGPSQQQWWQSVKWGEEGYDEYANAQYDYTPEEDGAERSPQSQWWHAGNNGWSKAWTGKEGPSAGLHDPMPRDYAGSVRRDKYAAAEFGKEEFWKGNPRYKPDWYGYRDSGPREWYGHQGKGPSSSSRWAP